MAGAPTVAAVRDGHVARIVIDNPGKRNAMTRAMWAALATTVEELGNDRSVRILVVTGAGDHFCAGADIAEFAGGRDEDYDRVNARAEDLLSRFPGPTVAMIRGNCVGGGVSIAAACDLRVAAADATFGVTPARLGLVYPAESLRRLVSLVGPGAAKHLLFTADLVDAGWAANHGLVTEVVAPVDLAGRVDELLATLSSRSSLTQCAMKEMVDDIVREGTVSPSTSADWDGTSASSGEVAEGVAAFAERRPARFPWSR